jgi:hypothetical protein
MKPVERPIYRHVVPETGAEFIGLVCDRAKSNDDIGRRMFRRSAYKKVI